MPFPTENDIYAKYSAKYKHSLSEYYNEMMIRAIIEAERDMGDACMFECDLTDGGLHEHADFCWLSAMLEQNIANSYCMLAQIYALKQSEGSEPDGAFWHWCDEKGINPYKNPLGTIIDAKDGKIVPTDYDKLGEFDDFTEFDSDENNGPNEPKFIPWN